MECKTFLKIKLNTFYQSYQLRKIYVKYDGEYKPLMFSENQPTLFEVSHGLHYINFYVENTTVGFDNRLPYHWTWENDIAIYVDENDIHICLWYQDHLLGRKIYAKISESNVLRPDIETPFKEDHLKHPKVPSHPLTKYENIGCLTGLLGLGLLYVIIIIVGLIIALVIFAFI
ncbi:MAG: hypothetical protein LUG91_10770 [Ruminococcus sp.]|nr:hypothetical protein [Ruminococcus sp.]